MLQLAIRAQLGRLSLRVSASNRSLLSPRHPHRPVPFFGGCAALLRECEYMRYVMKQKVFSLSDKFAIRNEKGEDAFFVNGEVFSLGHKLSFEDPQGNELLFIRQRLLSWGPTSELYRGEEHVATIKKEMFSLLQCTFPNPVDAQRALAAQGNL